MGSELTIDQRLFPGVSFYGEGIYGLRRSQFYSNSTTNQFTFAVPTVNPYYPTGAPTGLQVSYSFSIESPLLQSSFASAQRYLFGLNIDLPFGWAAQTYFSETRDAEYTNQHGTVNRAAVSAALGWTLPAGAASGTTPAVAAFSKPATIPYLNVFCDPRAFQCNSRDTIGFIDAYNESSEAFWVNEKAIKMDGPLFNLPGGTVRAAVGAMYDSNHFFIKQTTETSTSNTLTTILQDPEYRAIWAFFSQVNVPVIGDANALPFIRKFNLEGSWRHDQYSDVGGTSNPKVAFDWLVSEDIGLTLRGSWGTSFRAPSFGEFSLISNVAWNGWGLQGAGGGAAFQNNANIVVTCDPKTGRPAPGSGAEKLFLGGFACNSAPEGLSLNGGGKAAVVADFRTFTNQQAQTLHPELATNWSAGFEFAPTSFLRGLDLQATWYTIKINGLLVNFGNPTTNRLSDPQIGFAFLTPADVGCPGLDQHPEQCANFEDMVAKALAQPTNPVPLAALTLIKWINDGGTMNTGFQRNSGVDFSASYDIDLGDFGAWNTGITGTYYLEQLAARVNGGSVADVQYHVDLSPVGGVAQNGVESLPRFKYRARLGWSDGPFSVIGFMDYSSHFFHTQTAPPNVNFQCLTSGGTVGGGSLPCAISNYSNIEPPYYTFDLSMQYDTQDTPANDYLKHITLQLVIQDILDKHSPFEYRVATGGGNPAAFDITKSIFGRQFQVRIVKNW
jgi:iron complex outermembrane receptor protein